jgi:hypothetical protein
VQAEVAVDHELDERDAALVEDVAYLLGAEFGVLRGFAASMEFPVPSSWFLVLGSWFIVPSP